MTREELEKLNIDFSKVTKEKLEELKAERRKKNAKYLIPDPDVLKMVIK